MDTATLSRSDHDDVVWTQALLLLREGYKVQARLEGCFDAPTEMAGYRPDIVATRENTVLIVEVKKGDVDFPKLVALKRFADSKGWTLRIVQPTTV